MAVGALPEKIIGAFESVLDEQPIEEAALDKCDLALQCLGKIEEDVEKSKTQGRILKFIVHMHFGVKYIKSCAYDMFYQYVYWFSWD